MAHSLRHSMCVITAPHPRHQHQPGLSLDQPPTSTQQAPSSLQGLPHSFYLPSHQDGQKHPSNKYSSHLHGQDLSQLSCPERNTTHGPGIGATQWARTMKRTELCPSEPNPAELEQPRPARVPREDQAGIEAGTQTMQRETAERMLLW